MNDTFNPVGWFEIPVADMERATRFYEAVLAVTLTPFQMGPDAMAWFPNHDAVKGTSGSLVQAEGFEPGSAGTRVYFTAPDLDATLERALAAGGQVIVGRTDIGEFGFYAVVQDTEGNQVGLHARE